MQTIPVKLVLKIGICLTGLVLLFIIISVLRFLLVTEVSVLSPYSLLLLVTALGLAYVVGRFAKIHNTVFIIVLGAAAFVFALCVSFWAGTEPTSDFELLYDLSLSLKNGDYTRLTSDGYFLKWAYQSVFVIYQAFIMLIFGEGTTPLFIFNAIWMTGSVVLVYLLVEHFFSRSAARTVAVLYCLYPAPYLLASVLTNQHISVFFILLGLYLLLRDISIRGGVISGCVLALGNAFRPDAVIVTVSLAVYIIVLVATHRKDGVMQLGKRVAPYAVSITAFFLTGIVLSTLVMLSGVNPNGQRNLDPMWKLVLGLNSESSGGYSNELAARVFTVSDTSERNRLEGEIVREHLSGDKIMLMTFLVIKTDRFWRQHEATNWAFHSQEERVVPIVGKPLQSVLNVAGQYERLLFAVVAVLSLFGLVLTYRKHETNGLMIICSLVVLAFFLAYVPIETQPRYRYFVYPFFFIAASAAVNRLITEVKHVSTTRRQA